jgi:DNA-binding XRE family transcriptional regulator
MSFALPKPKSVTTEEVVLSREDWERIVAVLGDPTGGELEDDEDDIAAVAAARADDARFAARIESERGAAVEVTIPIEVIEAELDGAHPIRAWRDHRGWTQADLSVKSGVGRDLIAQLETRRKKGSIATFDRIAQALGVPIEALIEDKEASLNFGIAIKGEPE